MTNMYEIRIQTSMLSGYALGKRPRTYRRAMRLIKFLRQRYPALRFAWAFKITGKE